MLKRDKIAFKTPPEGRKDGLQRRDYGSTAPSLDDTDESPPVDSRLGHRLAVPQQDRDDIRESRPQLRLRIHVAGQPGETVARQDVVEQRRHLVAEMAALSGD
jgi:hypothetical protein